MLLTKICKWEVTDLLGKGKVPLYVTCNFYVKLLISLIKLSVRITWKTEFTKWETVLFWLCQIVHFPKVYFLHLSKGKKKIDGNETDIERKTKTEAEKETFKQGDSVLFLVIDFAFYYI